MTREAVVRGTVQPNVDDRALERETSRIERSLNEASNITPSFDLSGVTRQLSNLLPGGAAAGGAVSRIQDRMSSTTKQRTAVGAAGGTSPAVRELKRIRVLLEKDALTGNQGGGGTTIVPSGLLKRGLLTAGALSGGVIGTTAGSALLANSMFGEKSNTEVLGDSALSAAVSGRPGFGQKLGDSLFGGTVEDPLSELAVGAMDAPFEMGFGFSPSDLLEDEAGIALEELIQTDSLPELAELLSASKLPTILSEEMASAEFPSVGDLLGEPPTWVDRLFGDGSGTGGGTNTVGMGGGGPAAVPSGRGGDAFSGAVAGFERFTGTDIPGEGSFFSGDTTLQVDLGDLDLDTTFDSIERDLEDAMRGIDWERRVENIVRDVLNRQLGV